jgi:hypothetical protein
LHIDRHAIGGRKGHANKNLSPDRKRALRSAMDRAILAKRARTARTPEGEFQAMPNSVGENHTRRKLKAGELVLFMGVNQMRTPNIAMIAAACGFDGV